MESQVKKVLEKYPGAGRDKLIPILQEVQGLDGFISKNSVIEIGKHLNLAPSKIFGVATFYNQFRFEPKGKHHVLVCRGTACHVKGSAETLDAIERELGVKAGQTTRDGLFSIEVVACLGACGLAPLICVDNEFYANATRERVKEIINSYRAKEKGAENEK
ncbi:MAG TPA: NADH-quinone oxidoreductase subunit NuoE [bacterium]|nr:NADH-quinone oxidoreductase subunit NuoE [bacterium]